MSYGKQTNQQHMVLDDRPENNLLLPPHLEIPQAHHTPGGGELGCDIHTHAHAQDSLLNTFVERMGTVGNL